MTARRWMLATVGAALCTALMFAFGGGAGADASDALAVRDGVDVGDKAPEVRALFVRGESFDPASLGQVCVVEFWATWCTPCRASIPHLAKLAQKHAEQGLVVLGITDEDDATVKNFDMFEQMTYRVACSPGAESYEAWTAGISGIPTAFVVDRSGFVVWSGHPMDGLDAAVERALSGTMDIEAEKALRSKLREFQTAFDKAAENDDLTAALAAIDGMIEVEPTNFEHYARRIELTKFAGGDGLFAFRKKTAWAFRDSAETLNHFSWRMLIDETSDGDTIALAFAAAARAAHLAEQDPAANPDTQGQILDTLAKAWSMVGQVDKAIEVQAKAVECVTDLALRDELAKRLATYQRLRDLGKNGPPELEES